MPLDMRLSSIGSFTVSSIVLSINGEPSNGILETTANIHLQNLNLLF